MPILYLVKFTFLFLGQKIVTRIATMFKKSSSKSGNVVKMRWLNYIEVNKTLLSPHAKNVKYRIVHIYVTMKNV